MPNRKMSWVPRRRRMEKVVLACTTLLKDGMTIGRTRKHKLIKDVVVDFRES